MSDHCLEFLMVLMICQLFACSALPARFPFGNTFMPPKNIGDNTFPHDVFKPLKQSNDIVNSILIIQPNPSEPPYRPREQDRNKLRIVHIHPPRLLVPPQPYRNEHGMTEVSGEAQPQAPNRPERSEAEIKFPDSNANAIEDSKINFVDDSSWTTETTTDTYTTDQTTFPDDDLLRSAVSGPVVASLLG